MVRIEYYGAKQLYGIFVGTDPEFVVDSHDFAVHFSGISASAGDESWRGAIADFKAQQEPQAEFDAAQDMNDRRNTDGEGKVEPAE